ncbi:Transcription regulator protein [Halorhabdus tiamatea SARL4B]|uniref:Transcription regulator protein n=1 Tax=Halorhabdus tiamatea SARL4B TaxID=1033806 RepID=F7PFT0_9EURY|nr:IclR family transcriptional regulator [Halorhabdus tiamatea]ERJ04887.1 Transcription regulator protein [Halorhabdus tiamatea SARL4B]CCQ33211.1 transcriptional regulator, IclR family [Halorhabdus tiamatea SARL4B]
MSENEDESNSKNRIQSVENAFKIVDELKQRESASVSALARDLEIPKSTAHVYLQTLQDLGYVVQEDDKYGLSLRFLELGGHVRHDLNIYHAARTEIDDLSETLGEVATIGYEQNGLRVLVYRTEPTTGISDNAPTGEYTQMHWTALGKALLSRHSDAEVRDIADRHGLPAATEQTITDVDTLLEEIQTIRDQGYALEDEERVNGIRSIAVPIGNTALGGNSAISIAGPKHRFNDDRIEDELLPELKNAANVIELEYRHY